LILVGAPACHPNETGGGGGHGTTSTTGTGGDPAHLDPPPAGQGFQFGTPDFSVPSGTEEQDCYFFKVSDLAKSGGLDATKPVNLHHVQVAQRPGSHHMNIFQVKSIVQLGPPGSTLKDGTAAGGAVQKATNGTGQCFKSPNWADWPIVANSQQQGDVDWTFPDGVANVFQPDEYLMLQTHYVNAATQKTESTGHVRVNFWTIPDTDVKFELLKHSPIPFWPFWTAPPAGPRFTIVFTRKMFMWCEPTRCATWMWCRLTGLEGSSPPAMARSLTLKK
jgi:hypothetical protein